MSRQFQVKTVPSTWLESNGRRLDCGPYMSGAVEIRELLKKHHTDFLPNLTTGHDGGIYNGPQFERNYVDDGQYGVPFLTTTFMMQADLSRLPLLSKKDAYSRKLNYLRVQEGTRSASRFAASASAVAFNFSLTATRLASHLAESSAIRMSKSSIGTTRYFAAALRHSGDFSASKIWGRLYSYST